MNQLSAAAQGKQAKELAVVLGESAPVRNGQALRALTDRLQEYNNHALHCSNLI